MLLLSLTTAQYLHPPDDDDGAGVGVGLGAAVTDVRAVGLVGTLMRD